MLAKVVVLVLAVGYLMAGASPRLFDRLVRPGVDAQRDLQRRLRPGRRVGAPGRRYRAVRVIMVGTGLLFIALDAYALATGAPHSG